MIITPCIPPWLQVAEGELGVHEIPGPKSESRIIEYHATTTLMATSDEVPWCSSFMNWAMSQVKIRGTGSAAARSWLRWGVRLGVPAFGCVAVLSRDGNQPAQLTRDELTTGRYLPGHVGPWIGDVNSTTIRLIGGNQGDAVSIANFPKSRLLGYFWPAA
jgi:uncharacterized protein (TIGR02594 family)